MKKYLVEIKLQANTVRDLYEWLVTLDNAGIDFDAAVTVKEI